MLDMSRSGASVDDIVAVLKSSNQNMSQLIQAVTALAPLLSAMGPAIVTALAPAIAEALGVSVKFGSFTCAANTNTTVTDANVATNSHIVWIPTNATAGTLEGGTRKLYLSARTAATSFRVTTASGAAAGGTETFIYVMINPA